MVAVHLLAVVAGAEAGGHGGGVGGRGQEEQEHRQQQEQGLGGQGGPVGGGGHFWGVGSERGRWGLLDTVGEMDGI